MCRHVFDGETWSFILTERSLRTRRGDHSEAACSGCLEFHAGALVGTMWERTCSLVPIGTDPSRHARDALTCENGPARLGAARGDTPVS
jgi:hypothetical protein